MLSPAAIALKQAETIKPSSSVASSSQVEQPVNQAADKALESEIQSSETLSEARLRAQLKAAEALQYWSHEPLPVLPDPSN
jgi:hypothetical protein